MYHKGRNYKGRGKTRVDWPGSFHKARAPDVLYSKAFWTFSSNELQFTALDGTGAPTASVYRLQPLQINNGNFISNNNGNTTPHWTAVNMNNPGSGPYVVSGRWTDSTNASQDSSTCQVSRNANLAAGPMNMRQWARVYKYLAPYKTHISVEFMPAISQAGTQDVAELNSDDLVILYMMPNRPLGDVGNVPNAANRAIIGNPYNWSLNPITTNFSSIQATSEIKMLKLSSPNTIGGHSLIRGTWSLRNQRERNTNYMLKNVCQSTGGDDLTAAWGMPIDLTQVGTPSGTDAPSPINQGGSWWFYFAMGSRMGPANFSYVSNYRVNVTYFYKCWELRTDVTSWTALLGIVGKPPESSSSTDDMDFEQLTPYEGSIPSTPVIEQLTRELAQFGNVQKKPPFKRT